MRKSNLKAAEICILQVKMTLIVTFIQSSSSHPQLVQQMTAPSWAWFC